MYGEGGRGGNAHTYKRLFVMRTGNADMSVVVANMYIELLFYYDKTSFYCLFFIKFI